MSAAEQALRDIVALARTDTAWGTASDRFSLRSQIIELATAALGTEPPARGGESMPDNCCQGEALPSDCECAQPSQPGGTANG
jgi:hypothetical protein